MPLLFSTRNKLAYPCGIAPGFTPNHPAARGVSPGKSISTIPMGSGSFVDILRGKKSVTSGDGVGPAAYNFKNGIGPCLFWPNLSDYTQFSGLAAGTYQFATYAGFVIPGVAGTGVVLFQNGSGEGISLDGSLRLSLLTTAASNVSTVTLTSGVPYFVIVSCDMTAFFATSVVNFVATNLSTGQIISVINSGGAGPNVGPGTTDGTFKVSTTVPALQGGYGGCNMFAPSMMAMADMLKWAADPWSYWFPDAEYVPEIDSYSPVATGHVTYNLAPDTGFYTLTGKTVGEKAARQLTQQTGFYAYTGEVVSEKAARKIALNAAFYNLTGEAAVETASRKLTSVTGFYSLTGEQVIEQLIRKLAAGTGFYALTGEAVSEVHQRNLATATGFYTLTGKNVTQIRALKEAPATGFYNFVGEVVTLAASGTFNLALSTGFYALNGQTIVEAAARKQSQQTGFYVLTGEIVVEAAARKEVPQSGFYTYTGEVVTPLRTRKLAPLTGFYAMTGEPVTCRWIHAMAPAPGKYTLNGLAVTLNKGSAVTIIAQPGLMGFDDSVVLIGLDDSTNLTGGI